MGCLQLGEEKIAKVQREKIQGTVIVIGNIESGKSTFINYLRGCDLEYIDLKAIGINQPSDIVIVRHSSRKKEIMKIGHTKFPETFTPDIASVDGRVYCEFQSNCFRPLLAVYKRSHLIDREVAENYEKSP